MLPTLHKHPQHAGFTLVELAIVLVIIGLIIGGILVGQDMIKGAEIRATAGQIEKYNTTVNTFRDKYQFIPGDLTKAAQDRFGFLGGRSGAIGHGDGNGLLEACSATASATPLSGCETLLFWNDLNFAKLLDGSFTSATDILGAATTPDDVKLLIPGAKLGRGNLVSVYGYRGLNYYQIGGVTALTAGVPTVTATLTPQEAFNFDAKLDDGKPAIGTVRAVAAGANYNITWESGGTIPAACASATEYNTVAGAATATSDAANTPSCNVRVRFN